MATTDGPGEPSRPQAEGEASSGARAAAAVAAMWPRFRERALERLAVLEGAAVALLEGTMSAEARAEAEREAHKLAGALGTFGMPEGTRLARLLEESLEGTAALEGEAVLALSSAVVALRREVERGPQGPAPRVEDRAVPESVGTGRRLLIVEDETEQAERLVLEATSRGFAARVATDLAAARSAVAEVVPDLVLLDLEIGGGGEAPLALLRELVGHEPPIPAVTLTGSGDFADRVQVARLGGKGFLVKPLPPPVVLDAVEHHLRQARPAEHTLLMVDDDPGIASLVEAILRPDGIEVVALEDPMRFWDALERTAPDLVVLDHDMPGLNGIELCRVMRNDRRWSALPVLFLTGSVRAEVVEQVFEAGADDFVAKPIVGPELRTRIRNRLERTALHRRLAEVDELTGVANRRASEREMERLLRLAGRYGHPLALAILDIDRFKDLNDRWGHAVGDAVLRRFGEILRQSFRGDDVVARWGGEEFAVAMLGMTRDQGVERIARLLERVRAERFEGDGQSTVSVTFSAGVAEFPTDGRGTEALYRAADRALYRAKEAGRDRVVPVGWSPAEGEGQERVDVVLVEDDEMLAELLEHALTTRGLSTRWIRDGYTAARELGGAEPRLQAAVVVLDVGLPGLDGLTLLRRLGQEGLLERSRVLMLTARSAESEVLRALELGAYDHVAKPFSVPVLMHRVRRAMEARRGTAPPPR